MSKLIILFLSFVFASANYPIVATNEITIDDHAGSTEVIAERELTLTFVGDIMVHTPQFKSARLADGDYNFEPWFQYVKPYFTNSDLMIGNLETTLSERNDISGYPSFHSPVQLATALKKAGFDILVTANNHSLDNHLYGVETTLSTLRSIDIASTGTYLRDETAQPLIVTQNDIKIGLIASTYGTNGILLPKNYPHVVNINSTSLYQAQIKTLRENDVDTIIAFVHWGNEYQRKASRSQIEFANQLAELGVDIIIGSHPHVIQPDDFIETSNHQCYVVYSLGNAISNQRKRYRDSGLAIRLTLHKRANKKPTLARIDYLPLWVDKHDQNGNINYAMIPLDNTIQLDRLSPTDSSKMNQALADFKALYQIDVLTRLLEQ